MAARRTTIFAMAHRPRPMVLILGGFLTVPPQYGPLARRLEVRGAAGVVVAQVWTPDWMLAAIRGTAAIATRSGVALRDVVRMAHERSAEAPLLVVGHSAGGIVARLLTAPEPYPGRRFGAARHVGAIVTLGTPHSLAGGAGLGRRLEEIASAIARSTVPGAFWAPRIGYVTVGSRAVASDPRGGIRARLAHLMYRSVVGRAARPGTEGDGVVPLAATRLEGARQIVLPNAVHSPTWLGQWYGSDDAVDVWWPVALETWQAALDYRAAESVGLGGSGRFGGPKGFGMSHPFGQRRLTLPVVVPTLPSAGWSSGSSSGS